MILNILKLKNSNSVAFIFHLNQIYLLQQKSNHISKIMMMMMMMVMIMMMIAFLENFKISLNFQMR